MLSICLTFVARADESDEVKNVETATVLSLLDMIALCDEVHSLSSTKYSVDREAGF